jgi:stage III sporulation protein AD
MDIFKIVLIALLATVMILIIKQTRPELAVMVSVITITILFFFSIDKVGQVITLLNRLADSAGISTEFLEIILKIVGIAYVTEFGANICNDVGESAIASKVQLAGKCIIIVFGVSIIGNFLDTILGLL